MTLNLLWRGDITLNYECIVCAFDNSLFVLCEIIPLASEFQPSQARSVSYVKHRILNLQCARRIHIAALQEKRFQTVR